MIISSSQIPGELQLSHPPISPSINAAAASPSSTISIRQNLSHSLPTSHRSNQTSNLNLLATQHLAAPLDPVLTPTAGSAATSMNTSTRKKKAGTVHFEHSNSINSINQKNQPSISDIKNNQTTLFTLSQHEARPINTIAAKPTPPMNSSAVFFNRKPLQQDPTQIYMNSEEQNILQQQENNQQHSPKAKQANIITTAASHRRKPKSNHVESQRNFTRNVIDELDLWSNDLNQMKRFSGVSFLPSKSTKSSNITASHPSTGSKSLTAKRKSEDGETEQEFLATSTFTPTINTKIIDLIMHPQISPRSSFTPIQEHNEKLDSLYAAVAAESHANGFSRAPSCHSTDAAAAAAAAAAATTQSILKNSINTNNNNQSSKVNLGNFPKSMDQVPVRPMTLTSLNLKKPSEIKHKSISRYLFDADNKIMTKSDAQLQAEQNNVIINQIFKHKLTKVLDNTAQPVSKAEYMDIVKQESALFKRDTLSHFKSLHYLHGTSATPDDKGKPLVTNVRDKKHPKYGTIEYAKLYEELFEDRRLAKHDGALNSNQLEQERKSLVKQAKYREDLEHAMLQSFDRAAAEQTHAKLKLNDIRLRLNENAQQRASLQQEIARITEQFDKQIYEINRNTTHIFDSQNSKLKRSAASFASQLFSNREFTDSISILKQEKSASLNKINSVINSKMEEFNELTQTAERLQQETVMLKEQKRSIRHALKSHYMQEMNRDLTATRSRSLIPIIIKLLAIKAEITFNLFPSILDESSIRYLIIHAHLEQQKLVLKSSLKQDPQNSLRDSTPKHGHYLNSTLNRPNTTQNKSVKLIQHLSFNEAMDQLMAHRTKVRREGFNSSTMSSILLQSPKSSSQNLKSKFIQQQQLFSPNEEKRKKEIEKNINSQKKYTTNNTRSQIFLNESKKIEGEIREIDDKIGQIREIEIERILNNAVKESVSNNSKSTNSISGGISQNPSESIKIILAALIGGIDVEKYYSEFLRRKQKLEATIEANRTFNFRTAIHGSNQAAVPNATIENTTSRPIASRNYSTHIPSEKDSAPIQLNSSLTTNNSKSQKNSKLNLILPEDSLNQIKFNQLLLGIRSPKKINSSFSLKHQQEQQSELQQKENQKMEKQQKSRSNNFLVESKRENNPITSSEQKQEQAMKTNMNSQTQSVLSCLKPLLSKNSRNSSTGVLGQGYLNSALSTAKTTKTISFQDSHAWENQSQGAAHSASTSMTGVSSSQQSSSNQATIPLILMKPTTQTIGRRNSSQEEVQLNNQQEINLYSKNANTILNSIQNNITPFFSQRQGERRASKLNI